MGRPSISTERAEKKETNEEVEDPLQKIVDFFVQRIFLLIRAVDRPTIFKNKEKSTPFIRKKNDVGFVLFSFPHENGHVFLLETKTKWRPIPRKFSSDFVFFLFRSRSFHASINKPERNSFVDCFFYFLCFFGCQVWNQVNKNYQNKKKQGSTFLNLFFVKVRHCQRVVF